MKLTIENYREAVKDVDFSKLPEAAKDGHNNFDSMVEFYHDDKEIKEILGSRVASSLSDFRLLYPD